MVPLSIYSLTHSLVKGQKDIIFNAQILLTTWNFIIIIVVVVIIIIIIVLTFRRLLKRFYLSNIIRTLCVVIMAGFPISSLCTGDWPM